MFFRFVSNSTICTKYIKTSVPLQCVLQTIKFYSLDTTKIVRSVLPQIEIPEIFIEDYIWRKLDKWGHKTALQCGETGRSYLYSEVYKNSKAVSNFLRSKISWLKEKDTIAIILPNVPEYPIIMLGIIQAGFTVTTVNSSYTSDEIYYQLLNSEAKFVFTTGQLWPQVNQALLRLKVNIPVTIVKHKQCESLPTQTISFNEMIEVSTEIKFETNKSVEDTIMLPYSSGTTGLPKGVELTHKNIVANLCQMSTMPFKLIRDSEGSFQEVLPAVLPMYHIYGMVVALLNGLTSGSKLVTIPKFNPETFINVLEIQKPTMAILAPPIVMFLSTSSNVRSDLISQMRIITSGAAPIGASDIERLNEKSGGKTSLIQMYGLTETSPLTHSQTMFIQNGAEIGGSGLTIPNTECLIVKTDSNENIGVDPNVGGELLIRGPQIMKGYYKNPEATNTSLDTNGWLKTGDLAYFDKHDNLFVTDRLKELIKVKGFQVAPAELEEVLRNHPDIDDAGVVGVCHSRYGEVPKAFIVPKKNTKIDTLEIEKYVAAKVAPFKQLKGGIIIIDSIPKSPAGKILRKHLKML